MHMTSLLEYQMRVPRLAPLLSSDSDLPHQMTANLATLTPSAHLEGERGHVPFSLLFSQTPHQRREGRKGRRVCFLRERDLPPRPRVTRASGGEASLDPQERNFPVYESDFFAGNKPRSKLIK